MRTLYPRLCIGVFFAAAALAGCGSSGSASGNGNGSGAGDMLGSGDGGVIMDGDGGLRTGDGGAIDPCSDEAKLIYAVDENYNFYSFAPKTKTFTQIGNAPLACPAQHGATPFSMGIDRSPTAWVLYNDGEIFKVSTHDASCAATTFDNNGGAFVNFGMGFSADAPGSTMETLFIGGNSSSGGSLSGTTHLGKIAFSGTAAAPILTASKATAGEGALGGWPEMSGTGDAKLFGFFPQVGAATPHIAQLSKTDGSPSNSIDLSTNADISGAAKAWAFAVWGGDYWIFLKRQSGDTSTNVIHISSSTGMEVEKIPTNNMTIVGAGVSTCAPTTIPIN